MHNRDYPTANLAPWELPHRGALPRKLVDEKNPKVIGINRSKTFAFTDGLSSGELQGMSEALGAAWTAKFRDAEELPLNLIASRLPEDSRTSSIASSTAAWWTSSTSAWAR